VRRIQEKLPVEKTIWQPVSVPMARFIAFEQDGAISEPAETPTGHLRSTANPHLHRRAPLAKLPIGIHPTIHGDESQHFHDRLAPGVTDRLIGEPIDGLVEGEPSVDNRTKLPFLDHSSEDRSVLPAC
jgi:hypothetical protein